MLGSFDVSGDRIGALFEQLVFSQLAASAAAADRDIRIASYRTAHGAEVDFIVELARSVWAIELKASRHVARGDLRGLRSFGEYFGKQHTPLALYLGTERRQIEGIDVLPWHDGLRQMGL